MQFATPNQQLFPAYLPPVRIGETRALTWKLGPALNGATIASASLTSRPSGLSFTTPVITGDSNTTLTTTVSGGTVENDYDIIGTVILSNGQTIKPSCGLNVKC